MSRKKKVDGICHLCGAEGPLTFEHVPPRAAFNDRPVMRCKDVYEIIGLEPGQSPTKRDILQQGAGAYTLCARCNNNTGNWYARDFARWCYQGMDTLLRADGHPSLIYGSFIYPLRVIKQIATMFFSVNSETFRDKNEELVRFCLDPERKYLSSEYGFYCYYNLEGTPRHSGVTVLLRGNGNILSLCEITFPPYGYVLTLDCDPPDKRLFDITPFARYDYNEWTQLFLKLPVLPTYVSYMVGDYRTKDEIQSDIQANLQWEKEHALS